MFILPPHPNSKVRIRREDLRYYERKKLWLAQRKYNGTHVVVWLKDKEIDIWDRRGKKLSTYHLTREMKDCFFSLKTEGAETVLDGELLHTKAKSKITGQQAATNTIVLFDILFFKSTLLLLQEERLSLLQHVCGDPHITEAGSFLGATSRALQICKVGDSQLWLAETFQEDFLYHFDECFEKDSEGRDLYPEIEGLVLRLKNSRLSYGNTNEVNWLLRCRKPKDKMYDF